ncbi:MAG: phosphatase PAP2 family protein [Patescibacteria group bacterium]|nr:phosphatase PAP2 family protein [Patescibacteria group bacterium]
MTFADYFFIFGARYLYLLAGLIVLAWFWKLPRESKKDIIIFGIIALPTIYIVSKIGAWLYFDARPFVVGHFTPLIPHDPDNGFPSDHVLLVSAIASIIYPFSKKTSAMVWAIAILVGISRVYVGIHHLIDVVGSVVLSIVISALAYFVFDKFIRKHALSLPKN